VNPHLVRQFDHALGDGTFRVGLTRAGKVIMVIDVTESALGPLHLLFEMGRPEPLPLIRTGGIFGDIAHAVTHPADTISSVAKGVSHAAQDVGHAIEKGARDVGHAAEHTAEGAFNAASKVVTTVARPAFNLARDAAASGAHLVASMPFLPDAERRRIEAASRVIMRARLGDVKAKDFVRTVANAANAGVQAARSAGDALLTGTKVVAHVLDAPLQLAEHVPLLGGTLHALSPFQKMEKMADAIQRGDMGALKKIVTDDARLASGVVSLVPGLGSGIGAAIQTGLSILEGGGPLDIAIHAAYGAIPIPPGIRQVTDAVLEGVLKLAHSGSVTDVVLASARSAVPAGLPRDVFDTLAQLVVKRVPIHRAAESLVDHYVQRYAPNIPIPHGIAETVRDVSHAPDIIVRQATNLADAHLGSASPLRLLPPLG
jgi:hypothetical protein